jgi:hypothetical protein
LQGLLDLLKRFRSTPQDEIRILLLGLDNAGKVSNSIVENMKKSMKFYSRQHCSKFLLPKIFHILHLHRVLTSKVCNPVVLNSMFGILVNMSN